MIAGCFTKPKTSAKEKLVEMVCEEIAKERTFSYLDPPVAERNIFMGIDNKYLLFFKREHLWNTCQAVVKIANTRTPPTIIDFPEHQLLVPLVCSVCNKDRFRHVDVEFSFATSLCFGLDAAILDYLRENGDEDVNEDW